MQDNFYRITLALAGMAQSASLARDFAQTGKMDEDAFSACIYSIFQTDPPNISDVFGSREKLKTGLTKVIELFNPTLSSQRSQMRYLVSLIQMQKKIMNHPKIFEQLKTRIQQTKKQVEYFSLIHPTVIANLADSYLNAVAPFNFRILMMGNPRILGVNENMQKIRALLLAGIRSTVLWRQVGGSRWQLLFSRAKITSVAQKILTDIDKDPV